VNTLTVQKLLQVLAFWLAIATAAFFLSMLVSARVDAVGIDFSWPDNIVFKYRLQRVLAAALVGFALAAAGVTFQALLRNPLADPYVLGISSGSTVGVLAWMLVVTTLLPAAPQGAALLLLTIGRSVPAIVGAILTCLAVFFLARAGAGHRWNDAAGLQPLTLLLVGVVVSSINAALLMLLNSLAPHGLKADFATFLLGSISEGELTRTVLTVAAVVLFAGYLPTLFSAHALNIGTLSDVQATSLGINIHRLRALAFFCASIMTASAILLSGPIGFVGLICPHICRRLKSLGGPDHRTLLIAAPLCGAAFLMLADSAVRVSATLHRGEFPVGVVTALCGGPFFLFLLRRRVA
jgi:iron complex transport system permease protein